MILIFFPFLFVAYTASLLLSGWECCGIWITLDWIGWKDGLLDGWMNGCLDGYLDGWMQGGLLDDKIWRNTGISSLVLSAASYGTRWTYLIRTSLTFRGSSGLQYLDTVDQKRKIKHKESLDVLFLGRALLAQRAEWGTN